MDLLEYDHDDAPTSNQGFHCGALLAAMELGLPVTETMTWSERSAGYRGMFNTHCGFHADQPEEAGDAMGQDSLYGAALTYAVFGRKLLTDEQVLAHHRHSMKTRSPYGLRVISQADGSLLPNHSGSYVYGGSWFLCDSGQTISWPGVHGLPAEEVDRLLIERVQAGDRPRPGLQRVDQYGDGGAARAHILYSWNSGYWWIRQANPETTQALTGPDPVELAIDAQSARDSGRARTGDSPSETLKDSEQTGASRGLNGVGVPWSCRLLLDRIGMGPSNRPEWTAFAIHVVIRSEADSFFIQTLTGPSLLTQSVAHLRIGTFRRPTAMSSLRP
jgi:hypothetical protein